MKADYAYANLPYSGFRRRAADQLDFRCGIRLEIDHQRVEVSLAFAGGGRGQCGCAFADMGAIEVEIETPAVIIRRRRIQTSFYCNFRLVRDDRSKIPIQNKRSVSLNEQLDCSL